jgi:hypothetical protein
MAMSYIARLSALVVSAALSCSAVMAQGARTPAGYVTAVEAPEREGRPGAILKRDGQTLDVQIWTSLFDGDVLEVAEGAVTIETAKDKRATIDASRSPHRIEGELPTAGRFSAIASVVGDLFRQKPSRNAAGLIGRTGAPEIRTGGGAVQKVVAGKPLWIGWVGGAAPYTIEISGQSGQRNRDQRVLASQKSETDSASLLIPATAAGDLMLIVRDAAGREAKRALVTTRPPTFPDWVSAGAPTSEFAQVARALYLLEDASGQMDMLAATLAAEALDYPAAVALRTMLAEGRRP